METLLWALKQKSDRMENNLMELENFKTFKPGEKVRIDSRICQLHYRLAAMVLWTFISMISYLQTSGRPIQCISSFSGDKRIKTIDRIVNALCFVQSTYTYVNEDNTPLSYPGIDRTANDEVKVHAYYPMVPIVLFIQFVILLIPHYMWKGKERGFVSNLLKTGEVHYRLLPPAALKIHFKKVSAYLVKSNGRLHAYARGYLLNILLNTVAVSLNVLSLQIFLGGYFNYLGIQFVNYVSISENHTYRTNPLELAFPKMTKCTFNQYGPSGTLEVLDALCVMTANSFNQIIFIVIWFLYMGLLSISVLYLIMKTCQILAVQTKNRLLVIKYFAISKSLSRGETKILLEKLDFGQWYVIEVLRLNLSPREYKYFLKTLAEDLREKDSFMA